MSTRYYLLILFLLHPSIFAGRWHLQGLNKEQAAYTEKIIHMKFKKDVKPSDFQRLEQVISNALRPMGYYNTQTQIDESTHTIHVTKGPPTYISEIRVSYEQLPLAFNSKPFIHKVFTADLYQDIKNDALKNIHEKGYIEAKNLRTHAEVDPVNNIAYLSIKITPGPQFQFGNIILKPDSFTQGLIRQLISYPKNSPFSRSQLNKLQINFDNSGLFNSSFIQTQINKEKCTVDLIVKNTPRGPLRYTLGLGVESRSGMSITGSQSWLLNRNAHQIDTQLNLSDRLSSIDLVYRIPMNLQKRSYFDLGFRADYFTKKPRPDDDHISLFGRYSYSWPYFSVAPSLNYILNRQNILGIASFQHQLTPQLVMSIKSAESTILSPLVKINLSAANRNMHSDHSYLQSRLSVFLRQYWNHWSIRLQGTLGRIQHTDPLPDFWLYKTGGAYSIRGYSYQNIGPGDHLTLLRSGLFWNYSADLSTGIIYDMGDAGGRFKLSNHSLGLAANWRSPIGFVQAFIARPTSRPTYHFGVNIQP